MHKKLLGLLVLSIFFGCGQKGTIPVVGIGENGHEEIMVPSDALKQTIIKAMEQTQAQTLEKSQHELNFSSIVLGLGLEAGFDARVLEIKNKNVLEFHYEESSL